VSGEVEEFHRCAEEINALLGPLIPLLALDATGADA
jgi:hypothetical protein